MTGEITLSGSVLPIGGLKEKLLAALRAGVKTVIIPKENYKDMQEMPKEVSENMNTIFVESFDEVIEHALEKKIQIIPDKICENLTEDKHNQMFQKH